MFTYQSLDGLPTKALAKDGGWRLARLRRADQDGGVVSKQTAMLRIGFLCPSQDASKLWAFTNRSLGGLPSEAVAKDGG